MEIPNNDPDKNPVVVNLRGVGKEGTGCLIATAAYGSYLDPHVKVLRDFRDNYLITNPLGKVFVAFYYKVSPPIAEYISRHETLKITTRWVLTPVVLGIKYPSGVILIFVTFTGLLVIWRIRSRKVN